jgi:hypothetical protein
MAFFALCGLGLALLPCCAAMEEAPPQAEICKEEALPVKVAVLPFVNKTSNPEAAASTRKMFYNFFSSLNYHDIEPLSVDETLRANALYESLSCGDMSDVHRMGQLLGTDAVILGEVLSYGKMYALVYAQTSVAVRARMVRCLGGEPIWELEHEVNLREGDVPLSLTGVAGALVKTAISYNRATLVKASAQLCMEMTETIPNPATLASSPPEIDLLVHNAGNNLLRPGDTLRVVMTGDPDMEATWDIAPFKHALPMKEQEPGLYAGSYHVRKQDHLSLGRIVGHLKNPKGSTSHWVDILGPVALGEPSPLPQLVEDRLVLTKEKSPYAATTPVIVKPGAVLEVRPGSVVWFDRFGLVVQGTIHVVGTPEDPVRFSGIQTRNWKGVFLDSTREGSQIAHCRISGADFGVRAFDSSLQLDHCLMESNDWGLVLDKSSCTVSHTLVRAATKVGISARASELGVTRSVVVDNQGGGILLESAQARITQCSLFNNGRWDLKAGQGGPMALARGNWWGTPRFEDIRVKGECQAQPVLAAPPNFQFMTEWSL